MTMAPPRVPVAVRLLSGYVLGEPPVGVPHLGPCYVWQRSLTDDGYGQIAENKKRYTTHRLMYEMFVGQIPDGLQLDHLCRNRACGNPFHLEAVTARVNVLRGVGISAMNARKTHCPHGHPYDEVNTRWRGTCRKCRTCDRADALARYRRNRKEAKC